MLHKNSFFLACWLISVMGFAQEIPAPKSYIAYKTTDAIVVDGQSEEAWKKAPWSADFIDIEGEKIPKYQTRVKMLWDETYLYFFAKMEEPEVWGTLKQRDTVIFYNNDFEIFIDPDGDTHNYYEFEMNALNTVWDLFIVKPYRVKAPIVDAWNIQGLKSAVFVRGTLNNPADIDQGWNVEVAIPWEVLKEANTHGEIPENEFWRINFSRVNWDFELINGDYHRKKDENGNFLPEYNWVWSPQYVINMHEPERWGYVYFSSKEVGKDSFSIPKEERVKWMLYQLYRKQRAYFGTHGTWAKNMQNLMDGPITILGKVVHPKFEQHLTGWNISVKSPFSEKIFAVTEDGDFISLNSLKK